ncbi:MAG: hypothetical protein KGY70_20715 [Bacteroidales bacterium]|nr:hypothetical protein [Bacteroidales bacterium]
MERINVLYISGSLGLGHITRDLLIANYLRKLLPEADIEWLAASPATTVLEEAGEKMVEGIDQYGNETHSAEKAAKGSRLNLANYVMKSTNDWKKNAKFFLDLIKSKNYDLVIGDETYEIEIALRKHSDMKKFPFVIIYDFVGLDSMTFNPIEHIVVYYWNRVWSSDSRKKPSYDLALFLGEPDDIPDKSFGFMLPNRRDFAKKRYTFVGYVLSFDVNSYSNKQEIRKKLGYGNEPLVICSIGGTAIGKELLELCGEAYLIAREKIPNLHFVFVTGPRLPAESIKLPESIEVHEFVPRLYEHFAACDLAILQGGRTSTIELTGLKKPFIYFPIEGHCEQANNAQILTRLGAGLKLKLSSATPELLAEKVISTIGTTVSYPDIPSDGAQKAAESIVKVLKEYKPSAL